MKLYFVVGTDTDRDLVWLFVRAATGERALELFRENVRTVGVLVTAAADELPVPEGEEMVIDPAGASLPRTLWAMPLDDLGRPIEQ